MPQLAQQIEELFDHPPARYEEEHHRLFQIFKDALNSGEARAAQPDAKAPNRWRVNAWVKKGILFGFRLGTLVESGSYPARQPFIDKSSYPLKTISKESGVRIVPGGSSIRDGSFVGRGVVCMPPMFINVGAYVDEGTMVDSHALVGSCAQVGKSCHISAAAQLGGVLEPVGALPVIVEDEVMVGGNAGVYEGTIVKKRAVLGSGTILNRSTPVYDLVRDDVYAAKDDAPLVIPEGAIVVPGSRAITHPFGKKHGLSLYAAVIVKYRDEKTDARVKLEDLLH
ncbi:MAG: 2,3,4,5-tetrahydropyridine-2,6-dicarboxylate N-succinyltransferase [Acidobacteria bacterium]|nr:2,3,4,5-tetrahydropyridine-2,6-dicarboxylate N-succinyltransferase [Acidobacteriota bacterium]MBS1864834.1 2,3,4,5-tetrahydropyridine-2,6-dicarboxylate N-succinyltransferase [Acidobacteriota bacterium]